MRPLITCTFLLAASWMIWSGMTKPLIVGLGVASLVISIWLTARMKLTGGNRPARITFSMLIYIPWLLKEILFSSFRVSLLVWQPGRIKPARRWINCQLKHDVARSLYANSITLTPGTVCMGVEHGKMHIHALEKTGLDDLMQGDMEARVAKVVSS